MNLFMKRKTKGMMFFLVLMLLAQLIIPLFPSSGTNRASAADIPIRDLWLFGPYVDPNKDYGNLTTYYPQPNISVGNKVQLTPVFVPANATNKNLTWTSNSTNCTVDQTGWVTAVKNGQCIITITSPTGKSAYNFVDVVTVPTAIVLENQTEYLYLEKPARKINHSYKPDNASADKVSYTYTFSEYNVATGNPLAGGLFTPLKYGKTQVTISATIFVDGAAKTIYKTFDLEVPRPVTDVKLNQKNVQLAPDETFQFVPIYIPDNSTWKVAVWESSDPSVAKVDQNGNVTAIANGTAKITVTARYKSVGETATVTVKTPVTDILLNKTDIVMNPADTLQLEKTVLPDSASNKNVTYTSSDETVATVDAKGLITAVADGEAEITVQSVSDNVKKIVNVQVTSSDIIVPTSISVSSTQLTIPVTEKRKLTATVLPTNATNRNVVWSSSRLQVASVDASGNITANANGTATITARTQSGDLIATTNVTVVTPVTGVTLNKSWYMLSTSATNPKLNSYKLTPNFLPATASNRNILWTSSNTKVATVDNSGTVTAVGAGKTTITAKTEDGGFTDTMEMTVVSNTFTPITSVTLNKPILPINTGEKFQLTPLFTPETVTYPDMIWTSSDPSIASVDAKGMVTAKENGNVTITAVSKQDSELVLTSQVIVTTRVTKIEILGPEEITFEPNKTYQLDVKIYPDNASNKTYKWSGDSNPFNQISIDQTGLLKSNGYQGNYEFRVTSPDGVSDKISVKVRLPLKSVSLSSKSLTMLKGQTVTNVYALLDPTGAMFNDFTFTSSNPNVATVTYVSQNNPYQYSFYPQIKAVDYGTTTITAKTVDGKFSASMEVKVIEPLKGITINPWLYTLDIGDSLATTVIFNPVIGTNKNMTWRTLNASIATVSEDGVITGVSYGQTTVVGKAQDGGYEVYASVRVQRSVKSIKLNKSELDLTQEEKFQLQVEEILPDDAQLKDVVWSTSNVAVARVDEITGLVTGIYNGTATITATAKDGSGTKATVAVTVTNPLKSLSFAKKSGAMGVNDEMKLSYIPIPWNPDNPNVIWSSDNTNIATVSDTGIVKARSEGSTKIRIKSASDSSIVAVFDILIVNRFVPVTSCGTADFKNPGILDLPIGNTLQLTNKVSPNNATLKTATWRIYDTSIATLDASNKITGKKIGTTRIVLSCDGGLQPLDLTVNVVQLVTGVKIEPPANAGMDGDTMLIEYGQKLKLNAIILPENATNKNITWRSENEEIVIFNQSKELVIRNGYGETTIYATSVDGGNITASLKVRAERAPDDFTVDKTEMTLAVNQKSKITATNARNYGNMKFVTWSSSNRLVATVDRDGNVTAVSKGTAVITSVLPNGVKQTTNVTVTQPVSDVKLDKELVYISLAAVKKTFKFTASVIPSNANNTNVSYQSSNTSIATVDNTGLVTGKAVGETTITVTTQDGNKTATALVRVIAENIVLPTQISLGSATLAMNVTETKNLVATITPANTTNKLIKWASKNPDVATVDANGKVTAIANGKTTITATLAENGLQATVELTVTTPVSSITLNNRTVVLEPTLTSQLLATILPATASNKNLTWTSSKPSVASVNTNGKVTAGSELGTTTITVKSVSNPTVLTTITVKNTILVKTITLNKTTLNLDVRDPNKTKATLTATIAPANAVDKSVVWSSSNTAIATVNQNGEVTAVMGGTAIITATSNDGNMSASATVNVYVPVTGVTFNASVTYLSTVDPNWMSRNLSAVVLPENASNKNVTWTSSNPNIVTVDSTGKITAVAVGEANITVKTAENNKTATIKVIIINTYIYTVYEVYFGPGGTDMLEITDTRTYSPLFNPTYATNTSVSYTSSNPAVATVDNTGKVTPVSNGDTTIKLTTDDGGKTHEQKLRIYTHPTEVILDKSEVYMTVGSRLTLNATIAPDTTASVGLTWEYPQERVTERKCFLFFCWDENKDYTRVNGDQQGNMLAESVGTVTVSVYFMAKDGVTKVRDNVVVRVVNGPIINATGVTLDKPTASVYVGANTQLTATVGPNDATNKTVMWSSSDKTIATVDSSGKVVGVKAGTATITVTTNDGAFTATSTITVLTP